MSKRESLAVQIYHLQLLLELFVAVCHVSIVALKLLFCLHPFKYSKYASAIDIRFCFEYSENFLAFIESDKKIIQR